jgi:hypothetical protein
LAPRLSVPCRSLHDGRFLRIALTCEAVIALMGWSHVSNPTRQRFSRRPVKRQGESCKCTVTRWKFRLVSFCPYFAFFFSRLWRERVFLRIPLCRNGRSLRDPEFQDQPLFGTTPVPSMRNREWGSHPAREILRVALLWWRASGAKTRGL